MFRFAIILFVGCGIASRSDLAQCQQGADSPLTLAWEKNILTVRGKQLPGEELKIWYIEAYCRPGSTDREWKQTVIGHKTELVSKSDDSCELRLKCQLKDGVVVEHLITSSQDEIDFQLTATNPTANRSDAQWAQPCIRVDKFTGREQSTYLPKCFVFLDGKLTRLPTKDWATKARYTPGQVWAPKGVDREDVNPRPLNRQIPSHGLIGCFSEDETMMLASAWEPYQELFQGVITCIHSDFRIGGLEAGESKKIHGKIYVIKANTKTLLKRYRYDFPQQDDRSRQKEKR